MTCPNCHLFVLSRNDCPYCNKCLECCFCYTCLHCDYFNNTQICNHGVCINFFDHCPDPKLKPFYSNY